MPTYWSLPSVTKCLIDNPKFSCKLPDEFEGNGDIAGPGVFWAFFVAALMPIPAAFVAMIWEYLEYTEHGEELKKDRLRYRRYRRFTDAFLISVGDTQILTSLALLITVNFLIGCRISAYHYDLVCKLVLISSASHLASMIFVHQYFERSKLFGCLRFLLIIGTHAIGWDLIARRVRSHIFPNAQPADNIRDNNGPFRTSLVLPASCFIEHSGTSAVDSLHDFTASTHWVLNVTTFENFSSDDDVRKIDIVLYSFITVAIFLTLIASIVLHRFEKDTGHVKMFRGTHLLAFFLRALSSLIVYAIMIYGFIQFRSLHAWMQNSGWLDKDNSETNIQSFGQMLPVVLLFLPVISLAEFALAQWKLAKDKEKSDEKKNDAERGGDNKLQMHGNGK